MSTAVREPIAAGTLYEADPQELRSEIDRAINASNSTFSNPKVLVVPECGLAAAPAVAGAAMVMLESEREYIKRVVIIGDYQPGVGDRMIPGVAVPRTIAMRTPLGDLLLDRAAVDALHGHSSVVVNDRPFRSDVTIEVHLPPVQRLLGSVQVIPLLVGDCEPTAVMDVLERVWGGRDTLIIVSTSFASAATVEETAALGEQARNQLSTGDAAGLRASGASSSRALTAVLSVVARRSMGLLELNADTIPNPITGRGNLEIASFAAWESTDVALADEDVAHLRALAAAAVRLTVLGGSVGGCDIGRLPSALGSRRAAVVTLRREGQTRGSAGTIEADRPLAAAVARNASAACADPRLPSITPAELDSLTMTISIVSPIERIFPEAWFDLHNLIDRGHHGVLVTSPQGRAAQLPAMWPKFATHESFIAALIEKANLTASDRVNDASWYRFVTVDY